MKRFLAACLSLLVATTILMAQDGVKRYGIKSGTITMETEVMGQKIESTSYFDDYGRLEASKTSSFGMETYVISRDGKVYLVNKATKQVQEMPVQETINYQDLTDKVISKYKIQEVGHETVAGKECVKYTLESSQMGQRVKVTLSVWSGIPLKTVTSTGGMEMTATATKLVEGDVDPSIFTIPSSE